LAVISDPEYTQTNITVKAGEIVGYTKVGIDFSLIDNDVTLSGFIDPDAYKYEPWKIHTVDPFDYFAPSLRDEWMTKNLRHVAPYGGKIDYDVDGRLVGNWFKPGTKNQLGDSSGDGELAFAYNHIDPSFIEISMSNFNGQAAQFFFKDNAPDPKDVTEQTGMVKYELQKFGYTDPKTGQWMNEDYISVGSKPKIFDDTVQGTVLVQALPNNQIKFEAFPGKTAAQITGFTDKAQIYER
jgi:hypothetical protein